MLNQLRMLQTLVTGFKSSTPVYVKKYPITLVSLILIFKMKGLKFLFSVLICLIASVSFSQNIKPGGMIAGSLMNDQTSKALVAATIIAKLLPATDSLISPKLKSNLSFLI